MSKNLLLLFVLLSISTSLLAQLKRICDDAKGKFDRSVIVRIYSITKNYGGDISCKEQIEIGEKIAANDSLVLQLINTGAANDSIIKLITIFEKGLQAYQSVKGSSAMEKRYSEIKYFDEQMVVVNAIKPLDKKSTDSLKGKFNELSERMPGVAVSNRFNRAFHQTMYDTVYYSKLFSDQFASLSAALQVNEFNSLRNFKVSSNFYKNALPLVKERSNKLALVSYSNQYNRKYGDSIIRKTANYYDSLMEIMLIKDGALISSSMIQAAVRLRANLELKQTQTDSLIERGMYLNYLKDSAWKKNNFASLDTKDYENYWLSTILEPQQFAILLNLKHRDAAILNAENDWVDLEKRGLIKGLDKKITIIELAAYYTSLKSATSMYAYDVNKQNMYSQSIKEKIPAALKLLQYARKNNIINKDPEKQIQITW